MSDAVGEDRANGTAGVELEDVTIEFGENSALEEVSLSVPEGEFFTLVGPSGCGKTTTLRTIAGFETPDHGRVSIGGESMAGVPTEKRDVAIVFQNYALFPHMSVSENVAYGLRFRDPPGGVSEDERVRELLELVDLSGMGDREPESLSGGQRQRIALARALAPGPELLLLDEPLSALDARLRERLRVRIKEIQRELSITTVYVTHDQAEALAISDRVAVLSEGKIEQIADPETIYRDPKTRFVAEFVGDNNVFEANVVGTDPQRAVVDTVEFALPSGVASAGASVTLSVRPESISLERDDLRRAETTIEATVGTVEFLGDAYRLHCEWHDRTVLVRSDRRVPVGNSVALGINGDDVTVL